MAREEGRVKHKEQGPGDGHSKLKVSLGGHIARKDTSQNPENLTQGWVGSCTLKAKGLWLQDFSPIAQVLPSLTEQV